MTAESNYAIMIAILSDWFKSLAQVFQPIIEAKPKQIAPCTRDFSRTLIKLQVQSRVDIG